MSDEHDGNGMAINLQEPVLWDDIAAGRCPLYHATKRLDAVMREGLKPGDILGENGQSFGFGGYFDFRGKVSLTWNQGRALRYAEAIRFLCEAANEGIGLVDVVTRYLAFAGLDRSDIALSVLNANPVDEIDWYSFAVRFWEGRRLVDETYVQNVFYGDVTFDAWSEGIQKIELAKWSSWDTLVALDAALNNSSTLQRLPAGIDATLGILNPRQNCFMAPHAGDVGVVAVAIRRGAQVWENPTEDEICALPNDLQICHALPPIEACGSG